MSSPLLELEAMLLGLPRPERARLAERLIASLDEESEIEQAWAAEIGERIAAYRSGAAETFSAESVMKEARERLKR